MDDGHAEKAVVILLARLRLETVARMVGGGVEIERLGRRGHLAHDALAHGERDASYRCGILAVGGHQDMAVRWIIREIDRAHIDRHGLLDACDDEGEGLIEIAGSSDLLNDATEDIEHAVLPLSEKINAIARHSRR